MAKVSLRIYNRDIESLIDQGHLDEAIAHCRHILRTFPKHLETYRLLGKAYLEAKRYDEAVEIFSRTLMAVPDDFVAHVGMSIIRDDQGKLDDAIWHMERAFECQPSNSAIQGELRRLFGRRDGVEPPKIRMTRGALSHMYVQGELYPQAISEIKAVLGQDANRDDMKTLLARAYFHAGQKADASDICQQLLKKYPYSLDANRVMVELLQTSESVETTQVYRHRVNELDPYATFAQGSVFRSNEVSDAAISLERHQYTGQAVEDQAAWSAAGIGMGGQSAPQAEPEWLNRNYSTPAPTPAPAPAASTPSIETSPAAPASEEDIPDFMREAGWKKTDGAAEQPVSFEDTASEDELAPADMPDWLKAMAPEDEAKPEMPAQADDENLPEWLSGLGLGEAAVAEVTPEVSEPEPIQEQEPASSSDVPDWLKDFGETSAVKVPAVSADADLPSWLLPEDEEPQSAPLPQPGEFSTPTRPVSAAAAVENLGTSAQEQDDAIAWLESLASKHGAKPEELVTDPNTRSETPPDWVTQVMGTPEPETPAPLPPVEKPAVPIVPVAAAAATLGASGQEQEDAIAWLESLASKHGAKPEELVTDPNARSETPPDWVTQSMSLSEPETPAPTPVAEEPVAPVAAVEALGTSAQEQEDAIAWLESLATKHGAKPEELVTDPNARSETPPDWVTQAMNEQQPAPPSMPEPAGFNQDETGIWLRDLAEPAPAGEDLFETEPAFTDSAAQVSDWLNALDTAEISEVSPAPVSQEEPAVDASLPEWLKGLDKEGTPAARVDTDELPDWLREPEPPAQPEPTMPTDWHPVEAESSGIRFSPEPEFEQKQELIFSPPLEPEPVVETAPQPAPEPEPEPEPEPVKYEPVPEPKPEPEFKPVEIDFRPEPPSPAPQRPAPAPKKTPARKIAPAERQPARRYTGMLPPLADPALSTAQAEMNRGDIPAALEHYGKLIRKGKLLEEIIRDLREALYRYPVEVSIWQTLGDAYMRENRLQEALDSYTKAEELLR